MKMLGCGFGIVRAGRARWIGSPVNSVRIQSCKASTQSLAYHEAGMFTGTGEGGGKGRRGVSSRATVERHHRSTSWEMVRHVILDF